MQKNFLWAFLVAMMIMVMGCFPKLDPPKGGDSADETGQIDSGETGETGDPCPDADGDGHEDIVCGGTDCDDTVATVNPDAVEACNGFDDNCDGLTDDDSAVDTTTWYTDADNDGFGDADTATVTACEQPSGYVANSEDCDDGNGAAFPGNGEICDEVDNNCSGDADEGVTTTFYADIDEDGYGADSLTQEACSAPTGYSALGGDCDDANTAYNPGALEEDCADPADYNCDGSTGYDDADSDGWAACEECDDADASISPDGVETCNGIDDNCNGSADEDQEFLDWYADADSDGYGAGAATSTCNGPPVGFVESDSDCDDSDPSVYPSAPEDCTASVDMNCDGSAGADDSDGDGYRSCEDCDDTNPDANPGEVEVCDDAKIDEDCNGLADDEDSGVTGTSTWYYDGGDHDGYGVESVSAELCSEVADYVEVAGDCDDAVSTVNPGAQEVCDSADTDEDCDGLADDLDDSITGTSTWYEDDDHDGFGDSAAATTACDIPTADHVTNGADCDDAESAVNPGTPETCDSVDNNCDSSVDEGGVCADTGGDTGSDTGGDTGDTGGSSGGTLVEITFGDGGTCSADPFTDGGGGSIPSSMIYSDGGGTCGVHIYGSGSSSAPSGTKELLTTVTGLTSSTPYEVELELENTLPSTAVTVYSSFGGGTVSSVSVSGSSTDSLIFSFTASATEGDLEVWSGASTDYDVVVHSVTITY